MTLPEVIEVDPGSRWLVASRKHTPGAFWSVSYGLEYYGEQGRTRWEMRCACPHGRSQLVVDDLSERSSCAHLRAVVAFQNAKHARPAMAPNVSAMVD